MYVLKEEFKTMPHRLYSTKMRGMSKLSTRGYVWVFIQKSGISGQK